MPNYKGVRIGEEAYQKVQKLMTEKNLTFIDAIDKIVNRYLSQKDANDRIEELELEIKRLTNQSPQRTAEEGLHSSESGIDASKDPAEKLQNPSPSVNQVPFPYKSAYPIHPSRLAKLSQTLQPALTDTSQTSNSIATDTIQLSLKQQQILIFERERLQLRVAAARTIAQEKRETARQANFRRPQQRPIMEAAEPDTHAAPYWG